jgi:hypothetical protein
VDELFSNFESAPVLCLGVCLSDCVGRLIEVSPLVEGRGTPDGPALGDGVVKDRPAVLGVDVADGRGSDEALAAGLEVPGVRGVRGLGVARGVLLMGVVGSAAGRRTDGAVLLVALRLASATL